MVDYEKLYIVGIGASAGGFEAIKEFISNISQYENVTYIIAQHLNQKEHTLFGELLSKYSPFELKEVKDDEKILAKQIYYCPPNKDITIKNGVFHLTKSTSSAKPSIDKFFTSLAKEKKDKAIGIILSGSGNDGAKGISEIAKYGGITLTQDESATHFYMPEASINTGDVMLSLEPKLLAKEIENIIKNKDYLKTHFQSKIIKQICDLLKQKTGIDFNSYKEATIHRRIQKRLLQLNCKIEDYLQLLKNDNKEIEILKDEILIIVTSLFRDKDAFLALKKELLKLIKTKEDTIRIWVSACATGEEAYSIAIIVNEILENLNKNNKVMIFATDISKKAIQEARNKTFNQKQIQHIDKEYLKYFEFENDLYKPIKKIRDMIIFSTQDLLKDPPFSNIDLISCRNVLIYFNQETQKKILNIFFYSLRFDGILFLGKSETIGNMSFFKILNSKYKIYKKSNALTLFDMNRFNYVKKTTQNNQIDIDFSINKAIIKEYSKNGVVIDESNEILFYKGDTSEFFNQPSGIQTSNIFKLIKDYLKLDLRAILSEAKKTKNFTKSQKIRIPNEKQFVVINVFPLDKNKLGENTYFITFIKGFYVEYTSKEIGYLEDEVGTLKEKLQITIEELETANEELQVSNEELESSNEELQSKNIELQNANFELNYSNLKQKFINKALNISLSKLNIDLVILDKNFNVVMHTEGIDKFFKIKDGENFSSVIFNSNINIQNLISNIKEVMLNSKNIEYEIIHNNKSYFFSIRKINVLLDELNNLDEGIVLSFIDITKYIQQEKILSQQSKMASMGEMIGNIAHQWRQPLNALSARIIAFTMKIEMEKIEPKDIEEFEESTNKLIQYMSQTIDDFRNFFVPNKEKKKFYIKDAINSALKFVEYSYRDNNIELILNIDTKAVIYGYQNELVQVLLNILNNSKDAIKINKIKNPKVEIKTKEDKNNVSIIIVDNAGGIKQEIINKVFEPYFTTKFKNQGTGLGLYMSKMIIEKSMNGKIEIENIENGLKTTITLQRILDDK